MQALLFGDSSLRFVMRKLYISVIKRGFEKTMPQIKKPDDLQSIANLIRFFRVRDNFLVMAEIPRNNRFLFHVPKRSKDMLRQDVRILRADLASTAFGKNTAVYGHIDENGLFVRN